MPRKKSADNPAQTELRRLQEEVRLLRGSVHRLLVEKEILLGRSAGWMGVNTVRLRSAKPGQTYLPPELPEDIWFIDPLRDELGKLLKQLVSLHHRPQERAITKAAVANLAKKLGYVRVTARHGQFGATTLGTSALIRVPELKQGHLRRFRGQLIRSLCIENSDAFDVGVLIGPIRLSPEEMALLKPLPQAS
jgi:hypothetical protein